MTTLFCDAIFKDLVYVIMIHNTLFCSAGWGGGGTVQDRGRRDHHRWTTTKRLHPRRRQWTANPEALWETRSLQTGRIWIHHASYQKASAQAYWDLNNLKWTCVIYYYSCVSSTVRTVGLKCSLVYCMVVSNFVKTHRCVEIVHCQF